MLKHIKNLPFSASKLVLLDYYQIRRKEGHNRSHKKVNQVLCQRGHEYQLRVALKVKSDVLHLLGLDHIKNGGSTSAPTHLVIEAMVS